METLRNPGQDSVSFERLLGWFGRFTPQLKLRLMMLRKRASEAEFERAMTNAMTLFRECLLAIGKAPAGTERALWVYEILDQQIADGSKESTSCARGCDACCRLFPKQITDDEAELLARIVASGHSIDRAKLERQAVALDSPAYPEPDTISSDRVARNAPSDDQACPFLANGECSIYSLRPMTCRKYYVTTPATECAKPDGKASPKIDLGAEVAASAALTLAGPDGFGWMQTKLLEKLRALESRATESRPRDAAAPGEPAPLALGARDREI